MTLSISKTFAGKHIVVTGVTGFLGKLWLAMILEQIAEIKTVSVIVRGKRRVSAADRFKEAVYTSPAMRSLRKSMSIDELDAMLESKVQVLDGDCSQPLCGVGQEEALWKSADVVVHFAGLTDFEPDPTAALRTNVRGAEYAADLAAKTKGKRLLHVSTAFVAGNVSGDIKEHFDVGVSPLGIQFDPQKEARDLEMHCAAHDASADRVRVVNTRSLALGWPNIYTYTKGLAEHILADRKDVREGKLSLSIVRPSVVESARSYPFEGWNEGINTSGPLVWLLSSWFRRLPSQPKHIFDVVPVDTVARGTTLVVAAMLRGEADRVYHLASGDQNPFRFERAIDLTALAARRMHASDDASVLERFVIRHMDAVATHADAEHLITLPGLQKTARTVRDRLKDIDLEGTLPPKMFARWGSKVQTKIKQATKDLRNTDRVLSRIQDMLRLYRPFIHDNDYRYLTLNVMKLSDRLEGAELNLHSYDIKTLDWRHYWLEVHVPGLEKWSLPLMRGERVEQDPPPPKRLVANTQAEGPQKTGGAQSAIITSRRKNKQDSGAATPTGPMERVR